MSLVFIDSFAHYNTLLQKWNSGDEGLVSFNTDPAFIRTGPQSLRVFSEAFGTAPTINFTKRAEMVAGVAVYVASLSVGSSAFQFYELGDGDGYQILIQTNGAIALQVNSGGSQGQSAPGTIAAGQFYYIEARIQFKNGGAYTIRVNGETVLSGIINQPTIGVQGADTFFIPGSAIVDVYYNDLYVLDTLGSENNDFLGAVQIWAIYPDANETPLNWTPLANTNYQEVNQHPPPGDSAYVSDGFNGDIDQYRYHVTGPTGSYTIPGIQHGMCAKLDAAGSHTIASQIGSHTGSGPSVGSASVGSNYSFVLQPWDVNPETGVAFVPTDFASTFLGPKITS